ncbi:MAG: hypothetical protein P8L18_11575 [Verrucomicrobiota bacterium]|nr:hypothetical protein [Verrucomicrobiota bacterium]
MPIAKESAPRPDDNDRQKKNTKGVLIHMAKIVKESMHAVSVAMMQGTSPSKGIRRHLRMQWLLLLGAMMGMELVESRAASMQFDVFAGIGGVVRDYHWCPFSFEIYHQGPDFSGSIRLRHSPTGFEQSVPVELPKSTRKRIVVPVYVQGGGAQGWSAELLSSSGKILEKRTQLSTDKVPWNGLVVGSLARSFAGQPTLPQTPPLGDYAPRVGRMQVDFFPDQPLALEGLNALYLHASRAVKMKLPQVRSLNAWIAQGGQLIVSIEDPATLKASPWLAALLPFEPEGITSLDWNGSLESWLRDPSERNQPDPTCDPDLISRHTRSERQTSHRNMNNRYTRVKNDSKMAGKKLPIVTGRVKDGAVLARQGIHPLIVHAYRGRGQLTLLTFSPERDPILAWDNVSWFWAKVCGIPGHWFEERKKTAWGGECVDGLFGSMIESRQIRKLPIKWLAILLTVYILFIGPIDQVVLKRLKLQMWTWVTFPAYVALFSVVIYYVGFRLRAGDSEWNELHILDVIPYGEEVVMRGRSYGSLYAPSTKEYPFSSTRALSSLRAEAQAAWRGHTGGSKRIELSQETRGFKAKVTVPVWTNCLLVSDWYENPETAPIEAMLQQESAGLGSLEIRNHLPHAFKTMRLFYKDRVYALQGIKAGPSSRQTFHLSEASSDLLEPFLREETSLFAQALTSRSRALGNTIRVNETPETSAALSFMDASQKISNNNQTYVHGRNLDLTRFLESQHAVLLAWSDSGIGTPSLGRFEAKRGKRQTLVRIVIPLVEQPGFTEKPSLTP